MMRSKLTAALLAVLFLTSACGTDAYDATPLPAKTIPTPTPAASAAPPAASQACGNPLASYAAISPLPGPDALPAGSTMAKIKTRGRLIAGVSADTLLLGSRNPITGAIEGFDIDMLKAVSTAIFGTPDKIELRVISSAQRIPVLQNKSVDIVARNMTINCDRWNDIAFSTEYYRAGQKVMVPLNSKAKGLADLSGKRVCAPAASTSLDALREFPKVVAVPADTHTGCLAMFQEGKVDAITGDDTVLAGLAAQDPYAKVTDAAAFTKEPYGLGMNKDTKDLVQFVNAVLEKMRTDGQWTISYNHWLKPALGQAPAPPTAVYGRPQ
ncbi:glutamate ABC transporter substrate-binding protein [Kribbella qitaiheensis]|uniref:glutamate ABC transporter substrate-binding protein n=1 Tax=Kribbella qitaiheensis TaxID=1544730 RepID=UPI00360D80FD